ncbi:hypothetical protein BAUCODRAFT_32199 [Baudoinia panamericana UAMH 10762]|uniref:SigF-like NTF2-like domain-containing protein n=1 Tax=Baudoinia panamericana (strain UAMH 10762) TaxID=717646 RepID=M2NFZ5_BAUPA|nr:uncharacterized protein BAUCODRAFT_32199 [Baudoinia panamericana UAMH 10762]EMC98204.1 hypothetical protein BAUCODRAFT_32199 [Baudoinia panamericana UAMH 10762]
MDDPVHEISGIVHRLTEGTPKQQEEAINRYFVPNAAFIHPFCRTGSFEGSRLLIHAIFRWYKIMSPIVESHVNGVAYDEANMVLFVSISQVFAIWFIPFHRSPVNLTTRLQLTHKPSVSKPSVPTKYYIEEQNDLYQVEEFVKFFAPWGVGTFFVHLWHFWATFFCVALALIFSPVTQFEQRRADGRLTGVEKRVADVVENIEERRMHGYGNGARNGNDDGNVTGRDIVDGIDDMASDVKKKALDDSRVKSLMGFGAEQGGGEKDGQFGNMQVVT